MKQMDCFFKKGYTMSLALTNNLLMDNGLKVHRIKLYQPLYSSAYWWYSRSKPIDAAYQAAQSAFKSWQKTVNVKLWLNVLLRWLHKIVYRLVNKWSWKFKTQSEYYAALKISQASLKYANAVNLI